MSTNTKVIRISTNYNRGSARHYYKKTECKQSEQTVVKEGPQEYSWYLNRSLRACLLIKPFEDIIIICFCFTRYFF